MFPVHLDIELVDACNQSCSFCPRNKETHPDVPYPINTKAILLDESIGKIINEAKENNLYSINIAFGEPLIARNVFEVIKQFHQNGVIDSRLVTNGILLSKYTDDIFDSGLVNLYISVDAFSEETYKKQRGSGYGKVVNNVLQFLAEREKRNSFLPITRVSFVENHHNTHEVDTFKVFWADKVDLIDIQFYQDFNKFTYNVKQKKWQCIDPFRRIAITADGSILPCCTFYGKCLSIGNIKNMSITDAWRSERMEMVRENLLNDREPICLACQEC